MNIANPHSMPEVTLAHTNNFIFDSLLITFLFGNDCRSKSEKKQFKKKQKHMT